MSTLDSAINPQEQTSQGKGWIVSLITHILVIIALFLPMIVNKTPPPEEEGLLVNLGLLDEGQGEEPHVSLRERRFDLGRRHRVGVGVEHGRALPQD